jgi:hypothetical protein
LKWAGIELGQFLPISIFGTKVFEIEGLIGRGLGFFPLSIPAHFNFWANSNLKQYFLKLFQILRAF